MSNPVCGIIGMIIGIYVLGEIEWSGAGLAVMTAAGAAVVIICAVFKKRSAAVIAIFAVLGSMLFYFAQTFPARELKPFAERYVRITGRIEEIPYKSNELYSYMLRVKTLEYGGEKYEENSLIKLSAKERLEYGDAVSAEGFLREFRGKMNKSGFDSSYHYKTDGIFYKMYAEKAALSDEEIKDFSLRGFAVNFKNNLCRYISGQFEESDAKILKTVVTGNFKQLDPEISNAMIRLGVRRYLYMPYIHMLVICFFIGIFSSRLSLPAQGIITGIFMAAYAVFNSSNPVFMRVFTFAAAAGFLSAFTGTRRRIDYWSLSVLICGAVNPLLFKDPGFIMSAVSQFIFLNARRPVYDRIYMKFAKRGMRPGKTGKRLLNLLCVTLVFLFGIAPAAAYYFNGFSLWAGIAGVLYVPAALLLTALIPLGALAERVFGADALFCGAVNRIILITERIIAYIPQDETIEKFSYIRLMKPSLIFLFAYYAFGTGIWMKLKGKRQYYLAFALAAGTAVSGLGAQILHTRESEISFVNVDQGDAALIETRKGERILIDGGGGYDFSDFNYGEAELLPFLYDKGAWTLDHVIVSHYHKDHAWGVIAVMKECRVRNLYLPDCMAYNPYRRELEAEAEKQNTEIHYIDKPGVISLKAGAVEFMDVFGVKTEDENDTSLVARFSDGDFSALFTGDITSKTERLLIERGANIKSDLLKVPHHGSAGSNSEEFLAAAAPAAAVAGAGENNPYGLPAEETAERYERLGIPLLRTDYNGTVTVKASKNGIKSIKTYMQRK